MLVFEIIKTKIADRLLMINTVASTNEYFKHLAEFVISKLKIKGIENEIDLASGTGDLAFEIAKWLPYGSANVTERSSYFKRNVQLKNGQKAEGTYACFYNSITSLLQYPMYFYDIIFLTRGIYYYKDDIEKIKIVPQLLAKNGRVVIFFFPEKLIKYAYGIICQNSRSQEDVCVIQYFASAKMVGKLECVGFRVIEEIRERIGSNWSLILNLIAVLLYEEMFIGKIMEVKKVLKSVQKKEKQFIEEMKDCEILFIVMSN